MPLVSLRREAGNNKRHYRVLKHPQTKKNALSTPFFGVPPPSPYLFFGRDFAFNSSPDQTFFCSAKFTFRFWYISPYRNVLFFFFFIFVCQLKLRFESFEVLGVLDISVLPAS